MRVFAGPNGSGKSTVIEKVRAYTKGNKPIDFGYYINADEIARALRQGDFSFNQFDFTVSAEEFCNMALASGLIGATFPEEEFRQSFYITGNAISLQNETRTEQLAQIIADFLRKKMLLGEKKFSFETVFSHPSKLAIMRQAAEAGYKVYLYFVSTESPEINKFRVKARVEKGGHAVPEDKIASRYERSLDLLYDACQISYQAFFFDNSQEGEDSLMFAHFKLVRDEKQWDSDPDKLPEWFVKYYVQKM